MLSSTISTAATLRCLHALGIVAVLGVMGFVIHYIGEPTTQCDLSGAVALKAIPYSIREVGLLPNTLS